MPLANAQALDCGQRCGESIPANGQTCIAGEIWQCNNGQLSLQDGSCNTDPCQASADHSVSPVLMNDLYGPQYDTDMDNPDDGSIRPPASVQADDDKKRVKPDDASVIPSN